MIIEFEVPHWVEWVVGVTIIAYLLVWIHYGMVVIMVVCGNDIVDVGWSG